jgi:hypothetical protein
LLGVSAKLELEETNDAENTVIVILQKNKIS